MARIRVRIGVPRVIRWLGAIEAGAVAGPSSIYFKEALYRPDSAEGLVKIAHELKHVEQYRRLGTVRFLWRYVRGYARNRLSGMSRYEAYQHIEFEQEAFAFETMVRGRLGQRPR